MGTSLYIYLGPYVECVAEAKEREIDVWGCTNPQCKEYKQRFAGQSGKKFCADCGAPHGASKKLTKSRPDPYQVLGERGSDDLLRIDPEGTHDDDVIYFGSNASGPSRNFSVEADAHIDIDDETDRDEEVEWFTNRFADHIEKLKSAYEVTVRWGLHVYYW